MTRLNLNSVTKGLRRKRRGPFYFVLALILLFLFSRGCKSKTSGRSKAPKDPSLVLVTGYCNCGKCCSWKRSWFGFGQPVYDYGPMKGKPKKVGITASGTKAKHGTIAADPKRYPLGTHLFVPGYGAGTVEDIGGSIQGRHIDIWFPTHAEASKWGSRWLKVVPVK